MWSEHVLGLVEWAIDGTVVCALDDGLFLFFFFELDFVDMLRTVEVSAVVGDMILRSLTRLTVMVIDGDDMEHLPSANVDVYPAVSNSLMERSESQNVGV